ncbi:MAG: hypothetical protein FWE95_06665 [Planctomycetaceae bacterium]|nr:hypothetical protein [Planctomycetaceae bacterium]
MKHLLFCILFLFAAPSFAQMLDDSSYESLFKTAYQNEVYSGLSTETLEALIKFDALDLMALVDAPPVAPGTRQREAARNIHSVAERLFREGRIDEGLHFLKIMLPPQTPDEGMLAVGYVSEALLEQKRFEEAWQIADSGLPVERIDNPSAHPERVENVLRYIQRTVAKTFRAPEPSRYGVTFFADAFLPDISILNVGLGQPTFVPNEADTQLYRTEAHRALVHLLTLPQKATNDGVRTRIDMYYIPAGLAAWGYSKEAFEFADSQNLPRVLQVILRERRENGTPEENEQWFQRARKLYEEERNAADNDRLAAWRWPGTATNTYIRHCLDVGKYIDAIDVLENPPGRNEIGVFALSEPDELFHRISRLNVESEFHHNSKELIDRMIKYQDKMIAERRSGRDQSPAYPSIARAQLNLGLVDDAFESFRKTAGAPQAFTGYASIRRYSTPLEMLCEIVFYVHKHGTPEEASRMETEGFEILKRIEGAERWWRDDRHLGEYYLMLAMRFLKDGEEEMGARYLDMMFEQAEKTQAWQDEEAGERIGSLSELERLILTQALWGSLRWGGELDLAMELSSRAEPRYHMPDIHLRAAENYARGGETEKAKAALRKAFESIAKVDVLHPNSLNYESYAKMATLAAGFGDKEWFYEIMNAGMETADRENWLEGNTYASSRALCTFVRQLALYGDKDHPLFEQAEAIADGLKEANQRADLRTALGISFAILGEHETARHWLKKGIEARQVVNTRPRVLCGAVLEARAYARQPGHSVGEYYGSGGVDFQCGHGAGIIAIEPSGDSRSIGNAVDFVFAQFRTVFSQCAVATLRDLAGTLCKQPAGCATPLLCCLCASHDSNKTFTNPEN